MAYLRRDAVGERRLASPGQRYGAGEEGERETRGFRVNLPFFGLLIYGLSPIDSQQ